MSVAVEATIDADAGDGHLRAAGRLLMPPTRASRSPARTSARSPGYGYDERRHVTVWGTLAAVADGPG